MKNFIRIFSIVTLTLVAACSRTDIPPQEDPEEPQTPAVPENKYDEIVWDDGVKYVWDEAYIPEITIEVPVEEWNTLLAEFDKNEHTEVYVHCNVRYKKGSEETYIEDAGLRLRGNTSRRRPEGERGQFHVTDNTDWHKCHFGIKRSDILEALCKLSYFWIFKSCVDKNRLDIRVHFTRNIEKHSAILAT